MKSPLTFINHFFSLVLVFFMISFSVQSQDYFKGKILEKDTQLPIAFASVLYQTQFFQKVVISDAHGVFCISGSQVNSIIVSCMGYKSNNLVFTRDMDKSNIIIALQRDTLRINEVVIKPGNNPALVIIKKVLENKINNNYEVYDTFKYRCYFKTILDIKLANKDTLLDSTSVKNLQFLKKQAFFIAESVISCTHVNKRSENKIIATKTSGFQDPLFNQSFFSAFHHSISFYSNSISLFEAPLIDNRSITDYVSPISDGCLNSYRFQLEESYENGQDSIFVINFYPKRGTQFNSLKGTLMVSSNGFAIRNIVAEPVEKGLIDFRFRQDYEFINNKWFPVKLDEEIGFESMKFDRNSKAYLVYLISSRIDSVAYNLEGKKSSIYLEKVYVDHLSINHSDSILKLARPDTLSIREKNTYHFLDSIGKRYHFEYWAKLIPKLGIGRLPIACVDIGLNDIYSNNAYEGTRLGVGVYSNEKISKLFSVGGFVGYGFKDEKIKYGAQFVLDLNKYNEVQLKFSYQDNLKEVGRDLENYSKLSISEYLRNFIGYRFDRCVEHKMEFSFRTLRFLKIITAVSLKEMNPTYNYSYRGSELTNYRSDKVQISARYAYGEELETIGNQRVVNVTGNPVVHLVYKRGINLFQKGSYTYNRIEATLDVSAYKGRIGQSDIRITAGMIDKSLPYGLLFTGEGSKQSGFSLSINNSFQTMLPYEFLSDTYADIFYSHNFGSLLFKTAKFKPQLVVVQNSGWGSLKNWSYQGIDFKEKNKIYLESGLIINNIIRLNYLSLFYIGFGAGTFYRYGYYGYETVKNNVAVKLSLSIAFK